jgi:hypothetical protein
MRGLVLPANSVSIENIHLDTLPPLTISIVNCNMLAEIIGREKILMVLRLFV